MCEVPSSVSAPTTPRTARVDPDRPRPLFEARSVAVVGASARPDAVGAVALHQLVAGGFPGRVVAVNPRHDELGGQRCYPSLEALPEPVDLAIFAVPDTALPTQFEMAARLGVRAAVVFGGFSAVAASASEAALADHLGAVAHDAGMALCGPNGMGFIDFAARLRAVGYPEPLTRLPGPVTLLTQSGSVFSAVLHNDRGMEFDLAVSTGQEAGLTVADYMAYALQRDTTRVIALFLETLRDAPGFVDALALALERDVPVVALKVGRSQRSKELVRAHSGALAGDDAAYEALFETYGVARVRTLDELMDTVELFAAGRSAGSGGLATVHDSGGERAHLGDLAEEEGVPFAQIGPATTARLAARLDAGLEPTNPLDAWGSGRDFEAAYADHLVALHDDPDTAVVAFAVDLTTEAVEDGGFVQVAREVQAATTKPFAVLASLTSGIDRDDAARVRRHGVPVLEGTRSGLAAIRHLLDRRDATRAVTAQPAPGPATDVVASWRARLARGGRLDEADALGLLRDYGVPVVAHRRATSSVEAVAAAEEVGWPVVLKTAQPDIDHKSDVGGVRLGLGDQAAVQTAYHDLAARLGPRVLVSRMADPATELALGIARDPQFGPVLVVAAGGTLVELLRDRRVALPPVDPGRARRLVDRLAVSALLDGARGGQPADLDAVAAAIAAISTLAHDLGEHLDALDVNPLLAGPAGCVAVDALVVPRSRASDPHG